MEQIDYDVLEALLESGETFDKIFQNVRFLYCLTFPDLKFMQILIKYGFEINKNTGFLSFLCFSLWNNDFQLTKFLIEHGADPYYIHTYLGMGALHYFGMSINYNKNERKNMFLYLHHQGISFTTFDSGGCTPFDYLDGEDRMLYKKIIEAPRKWKVIKACTKFLHLHKQAAITANCPKRLKANGYFNKIEQSEF